MELTQLRQFKAIAENDSISAASAELHVSQPALSTMLRKLEGELGISLFERSGNRISLNEAGRLALAHANEVVAAADKMEASMREYASRNEYIRIGFCDPGPMWYCVPQLSVFSDHLVYEHYSSTKDELSMLLTGKYDIIISPSAPEHPGVLTKPFIDEQNLLSVQKGHPLANEKELSLKDKRIGKLLIFVVKGAFQEKQQPFWEEVAESVPLKFTEDYFLFSQMLSDPEIATTTTRIVKHYRNDGENRVLIPLIDDELKITYHISYLKKNSSDLKRYVEILEQHAGKV